MPGKRQKKNNGKKYKKRTYSKVKKATKLSYPGVCPDVMAVVLKYNENRTVNQASPNVKVYRGNSIFDPDQTGIGGQPMGRDEWGSFYRRYRVTASKITVRFSCLTNSAVGVQVVIVPLNTSAALTDPEQYLESANAQVSKVTFDTGTSSATISKFMTVANQRGAPEDIVDYDTDLSALSGSNPVEQFYWHVCVFDASGSLNNVNTHMQDSIEYWTEFYDRETLNRS